MVDEKFIVDNSGFYFMQDKSITNAKDWPKVKRAKFLTAGLVSYKDTGAGIALLKNETINTGLSTFTGKPVIVDHAEVVPTNYEKYRKGNVIRAEFNPADGWYYVDFLVDDDEALRLIEEHGYSVSCAYNVLDVQEGGLYQDIPYDGEITKISFTHLALVMNPRYEESKILDEMPNMLIGINNSKIVAHNISKTEEATMFQLFRKNKDGKQEEVTPFVLINGKEVPLAELVDAHTKLNSKDMKGQEMNMAKDEDLVDVNGNTVSVGEMKNAYINMKAKENGQQVSIDKGNDGDKTGTAQDGVDKAAKNAKEEEEKKKEEEAKNAKAKNDKEEEEKKNAKKNGDKFFAEMKNASETTKFIEDTGTPSQGMTRVERANNWRQKNNKKASV